MAKNNHSIGNAGEFYVLAQLAQRGYIAGKTDDGQTLIDVIATDPETLKTVNIQVKSTAQQPVLLFQRQERVKPVQQHQYLFLQYYLPNDFG